MIKNFKFLPNELINEIISYDNIIVYRNGKYIDRIKKTDVRYNVIKKIPKPIKVGINKLFFKLINKKFYDEQKGYFMEYSIDNFTMGISFVIISVDGFDKYCEQKTFEKYILNEKNIWLKV
jgi:hypothetical protein